MTVQCEVLTYNVAYTADALWECLYKHLIVGKFNVNFLALLTIEIHKTGGRLLAGQCDQ